MFSKTLTLDCNGNATMNFQGDKQNNNSYGKWTKEKDTLIVWFDSIKNRNNKFKGEFKFIIKINKLENIPFSRSKYNEFVELAKASGNDSLKIPSYRKFTEMTNQNIKDFNGRMGKQYFKKIEELECK